MNLLLHESAITSLRSTESNKCAAPFLLPAGLGVSRKNLCFHLSDLFVPPIFSRNKLDLNSSPNFFFSYAENGCCMSHVYFKHNSPL